MCPICSSSECKGRTPLGLSNGFYDLGSSLCQFQLSRLHHRLIKITSVTEMSFVHMFVVFLPEHLCLFAFCFHNFRKHLYCKEIFCLENIDISIDIAKNFFGKYWYWREFWKILISRKYCIKKNMAYRTPILSRYTCLVCTLDEHSTVKHKGRC